MIQKEVLRTCMRCMCNYSAQHWEFEGCVITALNKTFMEVDGIGQLSRFHRIINYGTQIVSLKKSQSAANIWNFP